MFSKINKKDLLPHLFSNPKSPRHYAGYLRASGREPRRFRWIANQRSHGFAMNENPIQIEPQRRGEQFSKGWCKTTSPRLSVSAVQSSAYFACFAVDQSRFRVRFAQASAKPPYLRLFQCKCPIFAYSRLFPLKFIKIFRYRPARPTCVSAHFTRFYAYLRIFTLKFKFFRELLMSLPGNRNPNSAIQRSVRSDCHTSRCLVNMLE
jgi:hypothetical protein